MKFDKKSFVAGMGCMVGLIAILNCAHPMPAINITTWAGDSANDAIARSQDKAVKLCKDPTFDNYICMTGDDLKMIYDTMLKCKSW